MSLLEFIKKCPRTGEKWLNAFAGYCSSGKLETEKCAQCIEECRVDHHEGDSIGPV